MRNNLETKKLNKLLDINDLIEIKDLDVDYSKSYDNRNEFDCIYFSNQDYEKYKNDIFVIVNSNSNRFVVTYPKVNDCVGINKYAINYQVNKNLQNNKNYLRIFKINNKNLIKLNTIKVQDFQDIKDESIKISESFSYLKESNSPYFILRNNISNCKIIVGKNHIKFSDKLKDNQIKLNRKQRILLNSLDIKDNDKNDIFYDFSLYPYPLLIQNGFTLFKKIANFFLKLYVGKVNIGLAAKRTYQSDETFNIVRLSSDIMKVIGIKDTDIVKLTYLDTSCFSRVLPIEDEDKLKELNKEDNSIPLSEFENMIFIPAFIRAELGIPSVVSNISVKVERDMGYIFKKNINQQILPIILILFSTEIFVNGRELLVKILIALISLPITMFFNLSNERAICK